MRISALTILAAATLVSCKKGQLATGGQAAGSAEPSAQSWATPPPRPISPTTLGKGKGPDSIAEFEATLAEVRAANTVVDEGGGSETLHLDEGAFQTIVSAFAKASRHRPDAALRLIEGEPGELRAAVASRHLGNLLADGGGTNAGAPAAGVRKAFDYVESIEDDDERRGAAWLLVRELLRGGALAETEVAASIEGLDGISHTTANRMVATTANRLRIERSTR